MFKIINKETSLYIYIIFVKTKVNPILDSKIVEIPQVRTTNYMA